MEGPAMEVSCPVCGKLGVVEMQVFEPPKNHPIKKLLDIAMEMGVRSYSFKGEGHCSCGESIAVSLTVANEGRGKIK